MLDQRFETTIIEYNPKLNRFLFALIRFEGCGSLVRSDSGARDCVIADRVGALQHRMDSQVSDFTRAFDGDALSRKVLERIDDMVLKSRNSPKHSELAFPGHHGGNEGHERPSVQDT